MVRAQHSEKETDMKFKAILAALACASSLLGAPAVAATLNATGGVIVVDGPRGTANNRNIIANAFDNDLTTFFELGYNAVVDFTFGKLFKGPGHVIEVTGIPNFNPNWVEAVKIEVGRNGVFTTAAPNPYFNTDAYNNVAFTFSGVFDTVRLTDVTMQFGSPSATAGRTGGFDVANISVSPVPVPAAGLLLVGALGGMAALRRRRVAH